jgi:hypothetical protein
MAPRYRVTLTKEEREMLEQISTTGVRAAKTILYARALLLLDAEEHAPKWKVSDVSAAMGMTSRSLEHLKERFVERGLEDALQRKKRETPPRAIIFDGEFEARLLQLACSEAPEGHARWTVRLLADKLVELKIVPTVSAMTVCNTLKKMNLNLISANTGKFRRTKVRLS